MNAAGFDQILRKVIVVPVIALLAGAAALAWHLHSANLTVTQIQLCDERIARTLIIEQLVIDQETGLRGYEINHDPRLLEQFVVAHKALPAAFEARRRLASAERQPEIQSLRSAYTTWDQSFAAPLIATIQAGGNTNDVELNYHGKLLMDAVRARIAALNEYTTATREQAVRHWHVQVRETILALLLAAVIIGLVLGLYLRRMIKQVSAAFRQSHNVLRIRAEQTFRSEERLRTTLRSIADGVITCDADGLIQSMNDMAQELTGWSEAEARERPLPEVFRIFDTGTREPVTDLVSRVLQSRRTTEPATGAILLRQDGSEIFVEDNGAAIRDKHGRPIGVVLVFRDVTMARKSQEALLANEKLAVAGRLAATIAHEIHNPLDSVANLLYLLDADDIGEAERKHFLDLANQEITRVTQISRAMLSLYRESRAPVQVDIREMLDSILLLMDTQFQKLGVTVTSSVPADLRVYGFPAELRQVFTNLLTNAAEASGAKGHIHVSASGQSLSTEEDGKLKLPAVLVNIEDDGPGVPSSVQSNLFQPFFTTKGERGTGLGLWISRGIIAKHGGSIELKSSTEIDHHGTVVSVRLAVDPVINPVAT